MATIQCVTDVLDLFARSKPGTNIKDFEKTVQAWYMVLEPLADEDVMNAAMKLARSGGDFLPSAGAVFQAVLDERDPEPDAGAAWALVKKHSAHVTLGDDNPVALPERAAETLRSMGGCQGWPEDRTFIKKEFLTLYAERGKRWRWGVSSGRLALPTVDERRMIE